MSIWSYDDIARAPEPYLMTWRCPFCRLPLSRLHKSDDLESPMQPYISEDVWKEKTEELLLCEICGWWRFEERYEQAFMRIESVVRAAAASLKELDLSDISVPTQQVRDYLSARYEKRFDVNPRLFEETVASVFRDLGYKAQVTGYRNDGGIDVILFKHNKQIGVQVKRYKARIEVEQIRSLAGALILSGITEGIYVTTSEFRSGCDNAISRYRDVGIQIDLLNAKKFYDTLGFAQRNVYRSIDEFDLSEIRQYLATVEDNIDHSNDFYTQW